MEFHISRRVREKYGLDETLFAFNGSAIFLNLQAVKRFADKLNRQRDLIHFPENAVKVGQANALGLIDEIFHYVIHLYRQEKQLDIFDEIDQTLETLIGSDRYTAFLVQFISEFPPQVVYDNISRLRLILRRPPTASPIGKTYWKSFCFSGWKTRTLP